MFRSVFVLSSFALFGLAFGSKINCPVSIRGLPGQLFLGPIGMSSGTVDVGVNADSKKWPGWEVVLTFDKDVKWISGFQHHDKNKCNGKTCSFLRDNWIAKKGQRNSNLDLKLDLGFLMWYQRYSKPPKVIGAKIASTQLDEKHRTYYDLCSKEEPIVIKPKPENVYPKCDEKFVKITTRQHNKAGYNGELFLIYPKTILNYKVEVKMNKPFDQMNVFNGKDHKCNGKKCTFRNHEWNAKLTQGKPKVFAFNVNYPAGKHTYLAQMKINGHIVCKSP